MAISPQTFKSTSAGRRSLWRAAVVILVFLLIGVAGGCYWFYSAAKHSLPQLDGTIALSGLKAPVTVLRDEHGVPTIQAVNLEDLFFTQGYVTAQDRLWSMDIYRRFAAGELAAALGPRYVKRDIYQRTLGFRQVAARAVTAMSPRDRAFLESYARGVNAYIQEHQHSLPLEFRVLRYFPRAWTVEDSFLVGTSLIEALNHGYYRAELDREKILGRLGPELTADLYVNSSFRDIAPGTDAQEVRADEPVGTEEDGGEEAPKLKKKTQLLFPYLEADALIAAFDQHELRPGSNDWVVSGAHTVSGKPLLSNDMHLGHRMPNVWFEAHLICGDYNTVGVTLPGVPFVIAGHNQRIAWGITNLGADVEDVYVETFNSQGQYQTPSGWQAPERRDETIRVIRGQDVPLQVMVTRHGPIISHLLPDERRMLALKSVNWDPRHPMAFPFFDINSAATWQQFTDALSRFPTPAENFVYADVDGHIGYHANGLIPIRAGGGGDGSLPYNGSDDTHEWTGYIPFDKLPAVYDPPSGIIATANSRVTPDGYPYLISNEWVPPYRTERIYNLLRQDKKFAPADMLAIQVDVYSAYDRFLSQRFVYALDHSSNASDRLRKAADLMRKWDGRMTVDSAAAAIVRKSRVQLEKMLLESKLGKDSDLYSWQMSEVWLENVVLRQPSRWLPKEFTSYDELLSKAVEKPIDAPDVPKNLASWKYGKSYPVELSHDLFGQVPVLKRWAGPGVIPQPGDGTTVWQAGRSFGPSERLTVDFSNLDNSTLNIVNGQSGHLLSPYLNDQFDAWYHGRTFALPYSEAAIAASTQHKLTLVPSQKPN